jgi:hypothetical protein
MPIKRRAEKGRHHKITAEARQIWASVRGEKICLTAGTAGLICHENLAAALGLPAFITLPDVASLAAELSQPLDEGQPNVRASRTRKPKT